MSSKTLRQLSEWGIFPGSRPCIIAGPCSAESLEQVLDVAARLPEGAVLRSGVWKPRSRPDTFEGAGEQALGWMAAAREKFGCRLATEVASAAHVDACLKYNIDIMWIGARTTTNPFLVQEIASALKGHTGQAVLVKNPVSPEVELWDGAIERLQEAGLVNIGAVSRGFSIGDATPYRNSPCWQVPIELRRRHPEMAFFCDPSHMAGDRIYVKELSQKALNLGYDGLMIETHCNPSEALSDSRQQLTPGQLSALLSELVTRKVSLSGPDEALEMLREQVDSLDGQLIHIIGERFRLTDTIGRRKKELNLTSLQPGRWQEVLDKAVAAGSGEGLNPDFVKELFSLIHEHSVSSQDKDL